MCWAPLSQYAWNIRTKLRTLRITSLKYPTYIVEEKKKQYFIVTGWFEKAAHAHEHQCNIAKKI